MECKSRTVENMLTAEKAFEIAQERRWEIEAEQLKKVDITDILDKIRWNAGMGYTNIMLTRIYNKWEVKALEDLGYEVNMPLSNQLDIKWNKEWSIE